MRKWTITLAILSLAGSTAMAANIDQGTRSLALSGGVDFDTVADTQFDLGIGYGYFVRDQLEIIGAVSVSDNDLSTLWRVGLAAEYNWDLGNEVVPYVGLGIAGSGADLNTDAINDGGSESGAVVSAALGTKYFMRDGVAPFIAVRIDAASEDIYLEKGGEPQSDQIVLEWGIRFYFD